jgi:CRP-like cAMP-binding protein
LDRGAGVDIELAEAEFFRAMSPERLQRVRSHITQRDFSRGRVLFFEGQPAEHLWAIQRGEVRQYKSSPDGHVTTLEVLGPGEILGALSALEGEVYPASAEGLSEGSAWCLKRSVFMRLLVEEPLLGVEVLRVVTHRLNDARERMRSFAHDPAPRRLAQALLRAARSGEAKVTRRDLAESAGTTVETAIRVMRGFERSRLVEGSVGRIRVLDEPALRAIAGADDA